MAQPIPIKIRETLVNILDMYEYPSEEVLVLEAIANGIDAKADTIRINFEQDRNDYYITFLNNGPPMNKKDFENYHTISSSTKTKGQGIGFAGVGAKIFLAAWQDAEIITITGKDNDVLVSTMFNGKDDIMFETSLEGITIERLLKNSKLDHKYGTSYKVKITNDGFKYLKKNITQILRLWFNYAMITERLTLFVNDKKINPHIPPGKEIETTIKYRKQEIPCRFYISDKDIEKDNQHIVYSVFGKRIKNETVSWINELNPKYNKRIFCHADVSILAEDLVANKENFKKNKKTKNIRDEVSRQFYLLLKNHHLITEIKHKESKPSKSISKLTRQLNAVLQNPDLSHLNPQSKLKKRNAIVRDKDGNIIVDTPKSESKVNQLNSDVDTNTNINQTNESESNPKIMEQDNKGKR